MNLRMCNRITQTYTSRILVVHTTPPLEIISEQLKRGTVTALDLDPGFGASHLEMVGRLEEEFVWPWEGGYRWEEWRGLRFAGGEGC